METMTKIIEVYEERQKGTNTDRECVSNEV